MRSGGMQRKKHRKHGRSRNLDRPWCCFCLYRQNHHGETSSPICSCLMSSTHSTLAGWTITAKYSFYSTLSHRLHSVDTHTHCMIIWQIFMNLLPCGGLVRISASWFSDWIQPSRIFPSATNSLKKWYLRSMCLTRWLIMFGFSANSIAAWLSSWIKSQFWFHQKLQIASCETKVFLLMLRIKRHILLQLRM